MKRRPIEILLVDDSPADAWLIRRALEEGDTPKRITVIADGERVVDYLHRRGEFANAPRPDLILLDLNLPRVAGLDVLQRIKTDPALRTITVIVLTTSEASIDINRAYDLSANCYVVKPLELDDFTATIRGIENFWMRLASLPSLTPPAGSESSGERNKGASADGGLNPKRKPSVHLERTRLTRRRIRASLRGRFGVHARRGELWR